MIFMLWEPLLRALLQCIFPGLESLPLVVPIAIPEQIIDGRSTSQWPFKGRCLRIPEIQTALLLDVNLAISGPYFARARAVASDVLLERILRGLSSGFSDLDLRDSDPRMSGFLDEIHCNFDLGLTWPSSQ